MRLDIEMIRLLLDGCTTPKALSNKLGIKPPSVVERLNSLRTQGLISRGHKEGKYQHYKVNRSGLLKLLEKLRPECPLGGLCERNTCYGCLKQNLMGMKLNDKY